MNSAYKWYSHNANIIQFYSGFLSSKKVSNSIDFVQDNVNQTYNYSANFENTYEELNLS